jgi:uncharacterized protein
MPAYSAVDGNQRDPRIDFVRGIALGGMLVVNLSGITGAGRIPFSRLSGIDWIASFLILFFAEGKFYPIFAFLFGWGIAWRQRNSQGDPAFLLRNLRRMLVLTGIGLAHAILLWPGDILFIYAMLGMGLPFLRRMPTRFFVPIILVSLCLSSLLALPGPGRSILEGYTSLVSPLAADLRILQNQSEHPAVLQRIGEYSLKLVYFPTWGGVLFASIIAGYLFGREKVAFPFRLGHLLLPALLLNLSYALLNAYPGLILPAWSGFWRTITLSLGGPFLALVYAQFFSHWSENHLLIWLKTACSAAGRMSLTLYLTQTLAAFVIVSIPLSRSAGILWLFTALIYSLQLILATCWLAHFKKGPTETAWHFLAATG